MSTLTITHSHAEGTLIDGTSRGDGSGEILKVQRWRWSRNLGSWYIPQSRDRLAKLSSIDATVSALRGAGFEVEIQIDDTYRPTAEVESDKIDRQKGRVEALDAKAERKAGAAEAAWDVERAAYAALPEGGEPIKIGHHSESRHRNAVDKAWNKLGKAVLSEREAARARGRADAAAETTHARYAPVSVARRIAKLTAELRSHERTRDGYTRTLFTNSQTGEKYVEPHDPAQGAHRDRVLEEIGRVTDELSYWEGVRAQHIADGKVTTFSREVVTKGDHVYYVGKWNEVVRVNAKTVAIRSIVGGSWTDRIPYTEIRALRTAECIPVRVVNGARVIGDDDASDEPPAVTQ